MAIIETVKTFNSVARTAIMAVVVAITGVAGWMGYRNFNADEIALEEKEAELAAAKSELETKAKQIELQQARITGLQDEVAEQSRQIEHLETSMRLLKMDHRVARLTVLGQEEDPDDGMIYSRVSFVEVNEEGHPIGPARTFRIRGDMVYVDYLVVKFEDKFVEEADLDRGGSICMFRRIFGEFQEPNDGFLLDPVGAPPGAYAQGGRVSDFERRIWDEFWEIANEPDRAQSLGVRAAHGEAVSTKVRPGKTYELELRASSGLSIKPVDDAAAPVEQPAA